MNFVTRKDSRIVIRQIPFLLIFASAVLYLPLLAYSLVNILTGQTGKDGTYFSLFMGFLLMWIFLEFLATRERIEVYPDRKMMTRKMSGVFRRREQSIDLSEMKGIRLERKQVSGDRYTRQYLYIYGREKEYLLNRPLITYLNQEKLGKLVGEATGIPYHGELFKALS